MLCTHIHIEFHYKHTYRVVNSSILSLGSSSRMIGLIWIAQNICKNVYTLVEKQVLKSELSPFLAQKYSKKNNYKIKSVYMLKRQLSRFLNNQNGTEQSELVVLWYYAEYTLKISKIYRQIFYKFINSIFCKHYSIIN